MEKFEKLIAGYTVLETENVDTDQIIPAVHLKSIERINFGQFLFSNWRKEGKLNEAEWPVNGALHNILVAGPNFGCGSSREHAVWALSDYGFKVILSQQIADIFSLNALNNGLLPITITSEVYQKLVKAKDKNIQIEVNLEEQMVKIPELEISFSFPVSPFKKECLIKGYDTVDYLCSIHPEIEEYEQAR